MATLATLNVRLTGDASQFRSEMQGAAKTMTDIGGKLTGVGKGMTAGVTLPLIGAGAVAVKSASDIEESANAVRVVFGEASDQVFAYGENVAQTAGLSTAAYQQMAAQAGAMLINLGLSEQEAAGEAVNLTQRAADMASIFNTDVADAMTAIQAGLRGEVDPLERFGVSLKQSAVEAKAMEMGLADAEGQLSQQALTTARLALLMEQTDKIAGDFVNTSDGLANSSRIAKAELINQAAAIGQQLLPVAAQLVQWIRQGVEWFSGLNSTQQRTILIVAGVAAAIGPLLIVLGSLISAIGAIIPVASAVIGGLGAVVGFLTGPVLAVIAVIVAAVVGLYLAWKNNFLGIQDTVRTAIQIITTIFAAFRAAFSGDWREFGRLLREAWDMYWGMISDRIEQARQTLISIANRIVEGIRNVFQIDWAELGRRVVEGIRNGILNGIQWVIDAVSSVATAVSEAWQGFWDTGSPSRFAANILAPPIPQGLAVGIEEHTPLVERAMQHLSQAVGQMKPAVELAGMPAGIPGFAFGAGESQNAAVDQIVDFLRSLPDHLARAVRDELMRRPRP